jgi:heme oxygenase
VRNVQARALNHRKYDHLVRSARTVSAPAAFQVHTRRQHSYSRDTDYSVYMHLNLDPMLEGLKKDSQGNVDLALFQLLRFDLKTLGHAWVKTRQGQEP